MKLITKLTVSIRPSSRTTGRILESLTKDIRKAFYQEESSDWQTVGKKINALEIAMQSNNQALKKYLENKPK